MNNKKLSLKVETIRSLDLTHVTGGTPGGKEPGSEITTKISLPGGSANECIISCFCPNPGGGQQA